MPKYKFEQFKGGFNAKNDADATMAMRTVSALLEKYENDLPLLVEIGNHIINESPQFKAVTKLIKISNKIK